MAQDDHKKNTNRQKHSTPNNIESYFKLISQPLKDQEKRHLHEKSKQYIKQLKDSDGTINSDGLKGNQEDKNVQAASIVNSHTPPNNHIESSDRIGVSSLDLKEIEGKQGKRVEISPNVNHSDNMKAVETLNPDVSVPDASDEFVSLERFHEKIEAEEKAVELSENTVEDTTHTTSVEIHDFDGGSGSRKSNYASLDAGATILDYSDGSKSATNLLVPDRDRYMLNPCEVQRKWVVISLSEDIHVQDISVANYEKFSSPVQNFLVLGSVNYPTDRWTMLGNFTANKLDGEQIFHLPEGHHVRYLKFRFLSHYGNEYYCTISQIKVYGKTLTEVISQLQKSFNEERSEEASTNSNYKIENESSKSPSTDASNGNNVATDSNSSKPESLGRCSKDELNKAIKKAYLDILIFIPRQCNSSSSTPITDVDRNENISEINEIEDEKEFTSDSKEEREIDPSTTHPDTIKITKDTNEASNEETTGSTKPESGASTTEPGVVTTSSDPTITPSKFPNGAPDFDSDSKGSKQNSIPNHMNGKASTNTALPLNTPLPKLGNLGRLESIFVTITKKIQALEKNQSISNMYLNELSNRYNKALNELQKEQLATIELVKNLSHAISQMKSKMDNELASKDVVDLKYSHVWEQARRENRALREELLLVREVITTLKAGIMVAIVLSVLVMFVFLLRLCLRCISTYRHRMALNKWRQKLKAFEKLKSQNIVNRDNVFGSSLDDFAIQRPTMYRRLLNDKNGFRNFYLHQNFDKLRNEFIDDIQIHKEESRHL